MTLNTLIYDEELSDLKKTCQYLKEAKVDAIIASDPAVIYYAHSIGLSVHISTQANITNIDAIKYYSQFADTMVLARELTL